MVRAVPNIRQGEGRDVLNPEVGHSPSSSADVQGSIWSPNPLKNAALLHSPVSLYCSACRFSQLSMKILLLPSRVLALGHSPCAQQIYLCSLILIRSRAFN